jgi:galactokinase
MKAAGAGRRAFSPGRVNLIGDHTDYNNGLALPMAIQLGVEVEYRPEDCSTVVIESDLDANAAVVPLAGPPGPLAPWAALAAAVVALVGPPTGGRVQVHSNLPAGAGLSSSAAFSVSLALALGVPAQPRAVAELCQRAERAVGVPVGLMDPLAAMASEDGAALLIDFSTLATQPVPVPEDAVLTVIDSGIRRRLDTTAYAERRAECEAAAAVLGRPLGACTPTDVASLANPVLRRRARHVTTEDERVRAFARSLADHDLEGAGSLMSESHRSLRDDFEVSTPELDQLVDQLCATPDVLGARLTGAGFGGCVVALSRAPLAPVGSHRAWTVRPSRGAWVEHL